MQSETPGSDAIERPRTYASRVTYPQWQSVPTRRLRGIRTRQSATQRLGGSAWRYIGQKSRPSRRLDLTRSRSLSVRRALIP
jgi:hypothetical protein